VNPETGTVFRTRQIHAGRRFFAKEWPKGLGRRRAYLSIRGGLEGHLLDCERF
jgi:hypothetical protein